MIKRILKHTGYDDKPGIEGIINRRCIISFLVLTFTELYIIPSNLLGWSGRSGVLFKSMSALQLLIYVGIEIAFWTHHMSVKAALSVLLSVIFTRLNVEVILGQCAVDFFTPHMVFGNFMMCVAAIIFAIVGRLKYLPVVMGATMPVVYIVCLCIGKDDSLFQSVWFFSVMALSVILLTIINYMKIKSYRAFTLSLSSNSVESGGLYAGNGPDERMEKPTIPADDMSHEERKSLDILSSDSSLPPEKAGGLIDRLSPERRQHIIKNVERYIYDDNTKKAALLKACPQLTESEFQICWLIVQGKSLREVCAILQKNESNITSQRSHIRRKLGLQRKDNLRIYLTNAINQSLND